VFLSVCYVWVFVLIWHADLFQCRNCSVLTTSHDTVDPASRPVIVQELKPPLDRGRSENS